MVWCAAVGCSNYKKKNRDLTFFNFPRDNGDCRCLKSKDQKKRFAKSYISV